MADLHGQLAPGKVVYRVGKSQMDARQQAETQEFLRELTELSLKHRIGIAGPFDIFAMEDDDFDRIYREDRGKFEFV